MTEAANNNQSTHTQVDMLKPKDPQKSAEAHLANPENIIIAKPGRKCSDDRDDLAGGEISRFGGDGGYTEGFLTFNRKYNLGLSPAQVVDTIVEISNENDTKYRFHTDDGHGKMESETQESQKETPDIGCGHLKNAELSDAENPNKPQYEDYELDPQDVKEAVIRAKTLAKSNPEKVELVKLSGDHSKSKGVMINTGTEKTIKHRGSDQQWYVIDSERDKKYVEETLFPALLSRFPALSEKGATAQEFLKLLEKQTMTTAKILAPGFEMLSINVDGPTPIISHAGFVPQDA